MRYILDSCIENIQFSDSSELMSKFVGVPRVFRNGNHEEIREILLIIL